MKKKIQLVCKVVLSTGTDLIKVPSATLVRKNGRLKWADLKVIQKNHAKSTTLSQKAYNHQQEVISARQYLY